MAQRRPKLRIMEFLRHTLKVIWRIHFPCWFAAYRWFMTTSKVYTALITALSPIRVCDFQKKRTIWFPTQMVLNSGDEGGRTPYLLNAIQALYQLSYTPMAFIGNADNDIYYSTNGEACQYPAHNFFRWFWVSVCLNVSSHILMQRNFELAWHILVKKV